MMTNPIERMDTVDVHLAHGQYDSVCTIQRVLVYHRSVTHEFFGTEAVLVDDLHLLEDS